MRIGVAALVGALGLWLAGVAAAAGVGYDFAAGYGTIPRFPPYTATFQFAAESGPLGQDAHGFYHQVLSTPDGQVGEVTGKVTCLIVTGNVATIGGVWLTSTGLPHFEPGWAFWLQAVDTKDPRLPDTMTFLWTSDTPAIDFGPDFPGSCATPLWADPLGLGPLATGHIVVHDALP
jgi:hypothetical protein